MEYAHRPSETHFIYADRGTGILFGKSKLHQTKGQISCL